jgi:cytochrome c
VLPKANAVLAYKGLDLTGVKSIELVAQAQARGGHAGGTVEIRTGSATGPVIGQLDVSLAGSGRGTQPATATEIQAAGGAVPPTAGAGRGGRGAAGAHRAELKPITGVHDLYFVFRNDKATAAQPLMTLTAINLTLQ